MSRSRCVVGRVARVFGIRGELVCEPGAFGAGPFAPNQRLWLVTEDATQPFEIVAVRPHRGAVRVGLAGIATPEAAAPLVGARIEAARDGLALAPDEYFDDDLLGLRLLDERGAELGRVVAVEHYPAQDCLVVEPGRTLVPLAKAFVRELDVQAGTIVMSLPAGLLEGSP